MNFFKVVCISSSTSIVAVVGEKVGTLSLVSEMVGGLDYVIGRT